MRRPLTQHPSGWPPVAIWAMAVLLLLPGCATFMPNTAEVLEPNTFEDLALAIGADVEALIEMIGETGWIGLLFL